MRLLLVEDDALLGDGIQAGLRLAGYAVDWVRDGAAAALALRNERYAVCVLDLGLPQLDGLTLLRQLRSRGDHTPVLVLSARDTREDKVQGLDAGADDYLSKPFDLPELQARLRALLRRASGSGEAVLRFGEVTLDTVTRRAYFKAAPVALSGREHALLHDLLSHNQSIRSRSELEQSMYAWGEEVESNAVEVYIHHLRKKFGAHFIKTVRGLGYSLGTE
jgi:DNA-binding response OmpR family regulator